MDDKITLDRIISMSPGTKIRFYDENKNEFMIKCFSTSDESTWDANHVVLGNVLK